MAKIRVLIVDDSVLMREALKSILESNPEIEVVGLAKDGKEGVSKALTLVPDVITMDLRMPTMTGLEAIEKIMEDKPIPIIVVSSLDLHVIIKALGLGAMDFVAVTQEIDVIAKDLVEKIKIASRVKPLRRFRIKPFIVSKPTGKKEVFRVVVIGISTGGPQALQVILSNLPKNFPGGIIIVQHMSKGFIEGLAEWLNLTSHLDVKVAKAGDLLETSSVFLAPDDYNLKIDSDGRITLSENTNKSLLHVPSIDEAMKSVASAYGENAIGVIMTGMGQDGVEGIKDIRKYGGKTIAQDEKTSVIFGMNKVAIDSGVIEKVVPLEKIAEEITAFVEAD